MGGTIWKIATNGLSTCENSQKPNATIAVAATHEPAAKSGINVDNVDPRGCSSYWLLQQ